MSTADQQRVLQLMTTNNKPYSLQVLQDFLATSGEGLHQAPACNACTLHPCGGTCLCTQPPTASKLAPTLSPLAPNRPRRLPRRRAEEGCDHKGAGCSDCGWVGRSQGGLAGHTGPALPGLVPL